MEDTDLLNCMHEEANGYISAHSWCERVVESYFGIGVGGIIAVFLFHIEPAVENVDEWFWVIVGDVPAAYIALSSTPNPACALDAYLGELTSWIEAVESSRSLDGLIPVNVPPTRDNARLLRSRVDFIDKEVLSKYSQDLNCSD